MPGSPAPVAVESDGGRLDLTRRRRRAELMDDPGLDPDRHDHALRALARVNRVSGTERRILREVRRLHADTGGSVSVVDVACGGGDVLAAVGRAADRAGVPVELAGCDVSRHALDRAARALPGRIRTHRRDVLRDALPEADLVVCNLFLHHLDESDATDLLARLADRARSVLLVQDLRRTRLGYLFAWIGLHALTTSEVARTDGLRSVEAAFTLEEARALCVRAGLADAVVEPVWPQRFTLRRVSP